MNAKKLISLVLALVLVLAISATAMAAGEGSITIANSAKGVTYAAYKLFDATVNADGTSIAYTGDIPSSLTSYFTKDANGAITATADAKNGEKLSDAATTALKEWTATVTAVVSDEGNGDPLKFENLDLGYYVVTTTQGEMAISVDSTMPNVTIYDKNGTAGITKTVNDADVDIGQTVTYTLDAKTSNFLGDGADAEIVTKYVISDTLPDFMTNPTVTKIYIDEDGDLTTTDDQTQLEVEQFDDNKQIEIEWAEKDSTNKYGSKYPNGAHIVVEYTATVGADATIDGDGNKNTVTLTAYTTSDQPNPPTPEPWKDTWTDDEIIKTYAAALQKVDENKKPLAGAKFQAMGLTADGSDGVYTVTAYDPDSSDYGNEMETDSEGQLVILGLSSGSVLTLKETAAPSGYNILVGTTTMTPVITSEEITATEQTIYYNADGKVTDEQTATSYTKVTYNFDLLKEAIVVVNNKGTELPSTGGMGTTMIYIAGGLLVAAAVILLITKRRAGAAE